MNKKCTQCSAKKPLTEFGKHARGINGIHPWCKACNRLYMRRAAAKWRQTHPDKVVEVRRRAYCKNPGYQKQKAAQYKKDYPDRVKRYNRVSHVRRNYGLEPEEFRALVKKQGGRCAICKRKPNRRSKILSPTKLRLDHDHRTGKLRGLLCNVCNLGLGHFSDNLKSLQAAICYLQEHSD